LGGAFFLRCVFRYSLGTVYAYGRGARQDFPVAVSWLKRAADQGLAPAQCDLGLMCEFGNGMRRDLPLAVKW
jgi:TPR repeat protein